MRTPGVFFYWAPAAEWYNPAVNERSWKSALSRTRRAAFGRLASLLGASELSPEFWQALEASLIQADMGAARVDALLEELRSQARARGALRVSQAMDMLRSALLEPLRAVASPIEPLPAGPQVVILVGVNGSGKTTAAARLAHRWRQAGRRPILAAADTYRAAAGEQLEAWARQMDIPLIQGRPGSDPGAVIYDAAQAMLARGLDTLVADTSGRMHTQHNLMAELQKICRVAGKVVSGAPHQVLLVLDATTGQNGVAQARAFSQAVQVTGIVLSKLDSSARGGVALAAALDLGLPIQYVGLGEKLPDLVPFDPAAYLDGLLAPEQTHTTPTGG